MGITSLWGLARSASALIPGLFLLGPSAALGIGILLLASDNADGDTFLFAVLVALAPLLFIPYAFSQVASAWRLRPSDVFLDASGLRVVGGRRHGACATWAELEGQGVSIRHARDKRWTVKDVFSWNWRAADREGVPVQWLVLGESEEPLAEAEAEEEQASLLALVESIQTGPFSPRRAESAPPPVSREDVVVLRCGGCGGLAVPEDRDEVPCGFCRAAVPVPAAERERIRAARQVVTERPRTERLVQQLLDQPGARFSGFWLGLAGLLMLAAWPWAVKVALQLREQELLVTDRVVALALFPWCLISGLYFLVRFHLLDRFALKVLAMEFGALPPTREGEPFFCRNCSAPLPASGGHVVVACSWCSAENVLGVDFRGVARTVNRQAESLEALLRNRARQRRRWGLAAVAAVGLLLLGAGLLQHAVRPRNAPGLLAKGSSHG